MHQTVSGGSPANFFFLEHVSYSNQKCFSGRSTPVWFRKGFVGSLWEFWWGMGKELTGWWWNPCKCKSRFSLKKPHPRTKKPTPPQNLKFGIESRIEIVLISLKHRGYFQCRLLRTGRSPVNWWQWLRSAQNRSHKGWEPTSHACNGNWYGNWSM